MVAVPRGGPVQVAELPDPRQLVPHIQVEESEHWLACGRLAPDVSQGWKLYVPMTLLNAGDMIRRLVPLTHAAGLHFKYVKDIMTLRKLNAGRYGYSQVGKCFVAYLPAPEAGFIDDLKRSLQPYADQCPAVPCARPFGDRLPLYYRYGSYRGSTLRIGGVDVADDRARLDGAVPRGMPDQLAAFTTAEPSDPAVTRFLRRYPAFRAIAQEGKCGVLHALDLSSKTFREVALKVGYHRGQLQEDGTDGCDFLRHELACYRLIGERGLAQLAPALVDSLDVPRKVILVLEYIDGTSLLHYQLAGELTVALLDRAWRMLERFHASGVYLGDAKLANFLATRDGDLRVVDFEAAGVVGDSGPPFRTFLVDPEPEDPRDADLAHFLASVLFPYEQGRYSWNDRRIDLPTYLRREPEGAVSAWALERLRTLLRHVERVCADDEPAVPT